MSAGREVPSYSPYERIITHLRTPLYRNGYLLTLSSLATSGIGLIYWILVAHKFSTYDVGINTAVISSMTFLAGIAEINLMSALIRFIPIAGRSTKRFVLYSYLTSLTVAAVVSFIFIKNLANWAPELKFLGDDPVMMIWFMLSTMMWCIFVLQDSVLTGLRQASWVPVENIVFSLTKIALMLVFAVSLPSMGIFASWSFALIVTILPTNYYIFRNLIPGHTRQDNQVNGSIEPGQVIRYVGPDYFGTLFWIVSTTLMPVIVTTIAGATANAYYYLAWTIANTLYLIGPSMGSSLVVEAVNNPQKLGVYSYRIFKNMLKLSVPAAVIIAIGAPYVLMVFGRGYSSEGANLLRLLALSAIPNIVNALFIHVSRVQRRMAAVVLTLGSLYSLNIALSYLLLRTVGITGVGIGWLVSQSLIAIIVYTTQLQKLWSKTREENVGTKNGFLGSDGKTALIHFAYQLATGLRLVPILMAAKKTWSMKRRQNKVANYLPLIIKELPHEIYNSAGEHWQVQNIVNNETNCTVAFLGPSRGETPVVLKLPGNPREVESLERQYETLISLNNEQSLGEWRELLPQIISRGIVDEQAYFAESAIPGESMLSFIRKRGINPCTINMATGEIGHLHRKTAQLAIVGMDMLEAWVNEPLSKLAHFLFDGGANNHYKHAIDSLETELNVALAGQQVYVSWIHGDYSPANILINPDGSKITGIVDWDLARPNEIPLLDLLHFILSLRMETDQAELGQIVCSLLVQEDWKAEELQLLQQAEFGLAENAIDLRILLLLTWLRHLNFNLSKTSRYHRSSVWVSENILPVLRSMQSATKVEAIRASIS